MSRASHHIIKHDEHRGHKSHHTYMALEHKGRQGVPHPEWKKAARAEHQGLVDLHGKIAARHLALAKVHHVAAGGKLGAIKESVERLTVESELNELSDTIKRAYSGEARKDAKHYLRAARGGGNQYIRKLRNRLSGQERARTTREETEITEVSPPGREEQVKALKRKGFPKSSAFAIAWASYKKSHHEEVELEVVEPMVAIGGEIARAALELSKRDA